MLAKRPRHPLVAFTIVVPGLFSACSDDDAGSGGGGSSSTGDTTTASASNSAASTATAASTASASTAAAGGGGTGGSGMGGSLRFVENAPAQHDYGRQLTIPSAFGVADFTLEVWIKPDPSFPVGPTTPDTPGQLANWSDADVEPYSSSDWWYAGNFLLDGHNNASFNLGTFSLQWYGGGRVRWLVGDGGGAPPGGVWSVGAYPATGTPSLLDGAWHQLTLVRRLDASSGALLELWIDGALVDDETTPNDGDLHSYWDDAAAFPEGQQGFFWGAEKQAAIGVLGQYEDYKGLIAELRFWSVAKTPAEIASSFGEPVSGNEPGLVGLYRFDEGAGAEVCDALGLTPCIDLYLVDRSAWQTEGPPL